MRAQTGTRRGTKFHCLDKKSSLCHDRNEHAEDIVIEPLPVNNRTSGFSSSRQAFAHPMSPRSPVITSTVRPTRLAHVYFSG